jgi:hypothetical protein
VITKPIIVVPGRPTPGEWEARSWQQPPAYGATTLGVRDESIVGEFRVIADFHRPEDAALCAAAPDMRRALVAIQRNLELAPRGNLHLDAVRDLVNHALQKGEAS